MLPTRNRALGQCLTARDSLQLAAGILPYRVAACVIGACDEAAGVGTFMVNQIVDDRGRRIPNKLLLPGRTCLLFNVAHHRHACGSLPCDWITVEY